MNEPQEQRKPTWKRVVKIVVIVLIVLLLVLLAVASVVFFYLDNLIDKMNYVTGDSTVSPEVASSIDEEEWITVDPENTEPTVDISDITFPEPSAPADQGDHVVNIMLVGQDARPGEPPQRSDSMILVTFNKSTGEIMLTSFMRDQYVNIPGYGKTKLCHAYSYGGMTLLNQTISNHYGIELDGNVTISFEGFTEIINMLGGVDIYLTEAEAVAMKNLTEGRWYHLKEGVNHLTGEEALVYSRLRHIDSDFQRTERQRKVILALIEAYKDKPLNEMMAILEKTLPLISTNISKDMIYWYAWSLFPMLSDSTVGSQRLPASGTFKAGLIKVSEGYMASCQYNIDFEANRRILEKLFDEIP